MGQTHEYQIALRWTGNLGPGTTGYREYRRHHEILIPDKPTLAGSSDPAFRGDPSRHNPEELLVAATSACHMLWYLHLCTDQGIVVSEYDDAAVGVMETSSDGSGHFTEIVLRPRVVIAAAGSVELATSLHEEAHRFCFIANSINFPIRCSPEILLGRRNST